LLLTSRFIALFAVCALLMVPPLPAAADDEIVFTPEFLEDVEVLAEGKKIWVKRCALCHGQRAYPGKAPKLDPSKLEIQFVYKRITKGFRGMPAWRKKYDDKQRMSITAYIMSPGFSN